MSKDLTHNPLFISTATAAADIYVKSAIHLDKESLVIFTCGAESTKTQSGREQLLKYAERYFKSGHFFRAEDAFPVLVRPSKDDYLSIEEDLAEYSDCVVIINESHGTLAELGAFASNNKIVEKLLVVNPREHIGSNSFINRGPIAKADKKSRFKTTIHVDLKAISVCFDSLIKRIEDNALRKYRRKVDFSGKKAWKNADGKHRLLFLQDLLNLFSPLSREELEKVLKLFFPQEYPEYATELSLLLATRHAYEKDSLLVASPACVFHRYNLPHRAWLGLRKRILDLYREYDPPRLRILAERSASMQ
jgi:hypothetical protein